jgi:hypothetical protein
LYCIPALPDSVYLISQLWADECSLAVGVAPQHHILCKLMKLHLQSSASCFGDYPFDA